jgi:hypothetical protein
MQSYKDKERRERTTLDYKKKSQSTPSWTRGLLLPEDLEVGDMYLLWQLTGLLIRQSC